uniref:Solute carrier family 23 member 3 n=1 Tax=Malurus cyaneus samueli TaxID=2593467 RepID=A0A8C5U6X7_9PASS
MRGSKASCLLSPLVMVGSVAKGSCWTALHVSCPTVHPFLFQVSGAVLVSGLIQLVLGVSGVCGWAMQHCGPMVLAPSLSIIGLSAYKEAAFFCSTNWGVALTGWGVGQGRHGRRVLLPFAGVCIVCAILSHFHIPWESLDLAMAQLSWANSTFNAPWVHIPYAGGGQQVGIAMAVSCSMNSVGCYVLCGRLLQVPRLPPHACNRGLCMEGLGSLLAGLLGAPGGTASSIANTCTTGLTQLFLQSLILPWLLLPLFPGWAGTSWLILALSLQAGCHWTSSSSPCSWCLSF